MLNEIRSKLNLKSKASKRAQLSWDFVTGLSDLLPFEAGRMAYGVEWAVKTGRLSGKAEMTVRKMTAWDFTSLLADLIKAGVSQNDIPRWLNQKLGAL